MTSVGPDRRTRRIRFHAAAFNASLAAACIALFALGACTPQYQPAMLLDRLKNRGPVLLSGTNPYLAANKFLTYQSERSTDIAGFLRFRGAPAAIEIQREILGTTYMFFYYPENNEYFTAEEMNNAWIINGPAPISNARMKKINDLLGIDGRSYEPAAPRLNPVAPVPGPALTQLPQAPPPTERTLPSVNGRANPEPKRAPVVNVSAYQEMVRQYGGSPAEISPRGDLVHYVTFEDESLEMIARWYTFDRLNTKRLATLNSRTQSESLPVGDPIIVPKYLLKNSSRMTEPAYKALKVLIASDR